MGRGSLVMETITELQQYESESQAVCHACGLSLQNYVDAVTNMNRMQETVECWVRQCVKLQGVVDQQKRRIRKLQADMPVWQPAFCSGMFLGGLVVLLVWRIWG